MAHSSNMSVLPTIQFCLYPTPQIHLGHLKLLIHFVQLLRHWYVSCNVHLLFCTLTILDFVLLYRLDSWWKICLLLFKPTVSHTAMTN